jgi:hypothetical protein
MIPRCDNTILKNMEQLGEKKGKEKGSMDYKWEPRTN